MAKLPSIDSEDTSFPRVSFAFTFTPKRFYTTQQLQGVLTVNNFFFILCHHCSNLDDLFHHLYPVYREGILPTAPRKWKKFQLVHPESLRKNVEVNHLRPSISPLIIRIFFFWIFAADLICYNKEPKRAEKKIDV